MAWKAFEELEPLSGRFCTKVRMYCTLVSVLQRLSGPNFVVARTIMFVRPREAPGIWLLLSVRVSEV